MARRALPTTAAAFAVSAALLLTGCGGGGKSSSDDIKGADTGSGSPSASASPSPSIDRPDLSLPKDLKLVFDFDKPSNADSVAALDDAANYIRALNHGITKQNAQDPAFQFYSAGDAARYANSQIKTYVKGGWTLTGTDRYYRAEASSPDKSKNVKLVRVSFCENQAKAYGKEVKTGKVLYTKASLSSYLKFSILMASTKVSPVWKAQTITVTAKAKECQE